MKKYISVIIFWGSLWGIAEATLGYILHIIPINIGWLIWFPLAFFFMNKVYIQTGEKFSVIINAVLAASIKLIDLINPIRLDYVINPAVSIVLESLIMFAYLKIAQKYKTPLNYISLISINTAWRMLYVIYVLFLPYSWFSISPAENSNQFIQFVILENILTSAIIYLIYKILSLSKRKLYIKQLNPIYSVMLLVISAYVQWAI